MGSVVGSVCSVESVGVAAPSFDGTVGDWDEGELEAQAPSETNRAREAIRMCVRVPVVGERVDLGGFSWSGRNRTLEPSGTRRASRSSLAVDPERDARRASRSRTMTVGLEVGDPQPLTAARTSSMKKGFCKQRGATCWRNVRARGV